MFSVTVAVRASIRKLSNINLELQYEQFGGQSVMRFNRTSIRYKL